jgi:hypothetical protein
LRVRSFIDGPVFLDICIIYIYQRTDQQPMRKNAMIEYRQSWAAEEFSEVSLGDKRLDARLIRLCDRFSDSPESPIN